MMKKIILILFIITSTSLSAGIDDIRKFKKCYALFTSRLIDADHAIMKQVIAGSLSGAAACKQLIATANLKADGTFGKNASGNYDDEPRQILRNFQHLHRSFFEVADYTDRSDMVNIYPGGSNIFDSNSDGYYWTHNLLNPAEKVSTIITTDKSYAAIRVAKGSDRRNRNLSSGAIVDMSKQSWNPPFVDQGLLVGIKEDKREFSFDNSRNEYKEFFGVNANQNLGAGVIGSQVYFFGNLAAHGVWNRPTGGQKIHRRWSRHVLKDMLCRDLPALRFNDVQAEVRTESDFPYRKSATCMQCHSSMDPMAGNTRNIVTTGLTVAFRPFAAFASAPTKPTLPNIIPELVKDDDFYLRPPTGRLMYRSYNGDLIKVATNSLSELGQAMANTDDFYVCAAKKYYKYLTGIEVSLSDLKDPGAPTTLSTLETKHRERVVNLGLSLRQHQNLQTLIEDIMKTKTFIYPEVFE